MKHMLVVIVMTLIVMGDTKAKGIEFSSDAQGIDNPLFGEFNKPIDFAALTSAHIEEATGMIQEQVKASLDAIVMVGDGKRTFENTVQALDHLYADYQLVSSPIYLMSYTHPDSLTRNTALEAQTELSKFFNSIELNEDLYKAVKSYSQTPEAKSLKGHRAKFLKETIANFERNGFALDQEGRDKLKVINDELSVIGDEFSKNIAVEKDFLLVSEEEIDGLPEDYKEARRQDDGQYKIDLSYPSYRPFMKYSNSENARMELHKKYTNRAAPENLSVLEALLKKRLEMSRLLGYDTYSSYRLENRMVKTPEVVWDFESKLIKELESKVERDKEELLAVKKQHMGSGEVINSWESSYYSNLLLKEKYEVDGEEVKQYFALDDVIEGLFSITQTLFDLEYREVQNPSVWHEEVRMFEVFQDGSLKGIFYLDLFPRENKFNHAACFGFRNGLMRDEGYQIPNASLVCNFPRPTKDQPALMPHDQVETLFHEFGHVLHQMVTTAELYSQSGTNVARDFVEAPSQIFENWAWNYDAVKRFAKHYSTREVMPESLFKKLLAAKNVGSGIKARQQAFYGTYDLTLHDKFDPNGSKTTTDVLREVQNEVSVYPYTEDTHFQAAFGHLNGYGSSYYGYMWSLVYAQDMFSVFEENGVLNKETGLRYRDIILARGSSENELDLVREFLGREPNNKAFLKDLGI